MRDRYDDDDDVQYREWRRYVSVPYPIRWSWAASAKVAEVAGRPVGQHSEPPSPPQTTSNLSARPIRDPLTLQALRRFGHIPVWLLIYLDRHLTCCAHVCISSHSRPFSHLLRAALLRKSNGPQKIQRGFLLPIVTDKTHLRK
eukprot:3669370-Pleurochrysis_carterae.AAC.1